MRLLQALFALLLSALSLAVDANAEAARHHHRRAPLQNGPNDDWQKWLPANWRSLPQFKEYRGAPYCGPCRYWDSKAGAAPGDASACRYWEKCQPGANGKGGKNCGPDAAFVNDNWLGHCENVYTGRYP